MKKSLYLALLALLTLPLLCSAVCAGESWPINIEAGIGLNSRDEARYVLMAEGHGHIQNRLMLKVGGWVVDGSQATHGYLSNAYVGLDLPQVYLAGGQKFVVFGPAGLLVSPGVRGGEAVIKGWPLSLHLVGGRTQFTPPAGHAGRTTSNSEPTFGQERPREELFAARMEYDLAKAGYHIYMGLNGLWTVSEVGASVDWEAPAGKDRTIYAEAATFDGTTAAMGGIRCTDARKYFHTSRETTLDLYWLKSPEDYTPAIVGASQYYPDRGGLAMSLNHKISELSRLELYGDSKGVTLNFMRHFSLAD